MIKPSLLAQSKSKDEVDSYVYEGKTVNPEDKDLILRVEDLISRVTSKGHKYKISEEVEVFIFRNQLVIYVRPREKDRAGRSALIACFVEIDILAPENGFDAIVVNAVTEFARSLDRTLSHNSILSLEKGVSFAKKKFSHQLQTFVIWSLVGSIILFYLLRELGLFGQ